MTYIHIILCLCMTVTRTAEAMTGTPSSKKRNITPRGERFCVWLRLFTQNGSAKQYLHKNANILLRYKLIHYMAKILFGEGLATQNVVYMDNSDKRAFSLQHAVQWQDTHTHLESFHLNMHTHITYHIKRGAAVFLLVWKYGRMGKVKKHGILRSGK